MKPALRPLFAIFCIASSALFLLANGALAYQSTAVQPPEVTGLPALRSVGAARLTVWGFQFYDARLWAPAEFSADDYARSGFALELTYLRSFDHGSIAERSIKEMRSIGSMGEPQAAQWLAQMRKIFPDIAKGDRLVGVHKPGEGATFTFNGKPAGEIRDPEFGRLFFGIWLSPQTSQPQMRRELLGLHNPAKR